MISSWFILALLSATPAPASAPAVNDPDVQARRLIYFPPHKFTAVREVTSASAVLWTNVDSISDEALAGTLRQAVEVLEELRPRATSQPVTQPASAPAGPPVSLALYQSQEQFRELWHRVGVLYGGTIFVGDSAGYSYRVFAASFVDAARPDQPPPELIHEFAHLWLWQNLNLPNDGNWLSEGLAGWVQHRVGPNPDGRALWAEQIAAGKYVPLSRLTARSPLPAEQYWQAELLVETILRHHPLALPAVIEAVAQGRPAGQIVAEVLRTDWLTLHKQWAETSKSMTRLNGASTLHILPP